MSLPEESEVPSLPATQARMVKQVCDRFESAWRAGRRPRIEDFLGEAAGPARSSLLSELLCMEVAYRRLLGEDPQPEDYASLLSAQDWGRIESESTRRTGLARSTIEADEGEDSSPRPDDPRDDRQPTTERAAGPRRAPAARRVSASATETATETAEFPGPSTPGTESAAEPAAGPTSTFQVADAQGAPWPRTGPIDPPATDPDATGDYSSDQGQGATTDPADRGDPGDGFEETPLPGVATRTEVPALDPMGGRPWERPASTEHAPDPRRVPRRGPTIPGYQIIEVLGRGGMGLVYKAHHLALDRTVALKVILGGEHAGDDQRARFLVEAQAIARLIHPQIVQIYEIGRTQGLPYFSLEYVDGGSLEQKVDRQPQDPSWSAALVETIARTMQAAHRNGVIHRDLKPSNILLTQDGVPKITDFGLAKRLESDSDQTRTGSIMGTPTYMSPEQAWGRNLEVGPLADLYSIGAILYTLLTGRPPLQGTTSLETLDQVRTREPVPPAQLQPKLPRDLETICLKCLQKEPAKRYESAEALAEDLGRFLRREPIRARPVSAPERLWRLARRNPKVAGLSTAVLVLVVAVAVIMSAAAVKLKQSNDLLERSNAAEKSARKKAEVGLAQAFISDSAALDAWRTLGRFVLEDLKAVSGAHPLRQKFLDDIYRGLSKMAQRMEPLYQVYRQVETAEKADFAMAGVHKLLGDEMLELGRAREALEHYQSMNRISESAVAAAPKSLDLKVQLANSRAALGTFSLKVLGDPPAARGYLEGALTLRRERLAGEPQSDEAKLGVANALGQLAICCQLMGDPAAARALFEEELPVRASLSEPARRDFEARRELAGLHEKLGQVSRSLGDVAAARRSYDLSFKIRKELANEAPDRIAGLRDVYLSMIDFGDVNLMTLHDPARAGDYYRRALVGFRELHQREPSVILKGDIARGCYYLATALLRQGQPEEARRLYGECLEIRRNLARDPAAKLDEIDLVVAMARGGEHEEAAGRALRMIETPPKSAMIYVEVACALALCAGAASEPGLKKTYTEETLRAIRKGFEDGWRDLDRLRTDPDFDPVRGDVEFQRLLAQLEVEAKTPAAKR